MNPFGANISVSSETEIIIADSLDPRHPYSGTSWIDFSLY